MITIIELLDVDLVNKFYEEYSDYEILNCLEYTLYDLNDHLKCGKKYLLTNYNQSNLRLLRDTNFSDFIILKKINDRSVNFDYQNANLYVKYEGNSIHINSISYLFKRTLDVLFTHDKLSVIKCCKDLSVDYKDFFKELL